VNSRGHDESLRPAGLWSHDLRATSIKRRRLRTPAANVDSFNIDRDDPCRLVRQVKKIPWLELVTDGSKDPCHLVWQVNRILQRSMSTVICPAFEIARVRI
jgi:hypothetical protein